MADPTSMSAEVLAVTPQDTNPLVPRAGMMALAEMSDDEFSGRLKLLKKGRDRIEQIKREMMVEDVHYGTVPGTPKPTILKPGLEVLCEIYGLRARFEPEIIPGDGVTDPALRVVTKCVLHLGTLDGPAIAEGHGAANSWERRHRYRIAQRGCPECGIVGALLKSKRDPGFFCWDKKGGCGANFEPNDQRILGQELGQIENADPHDLENTLVKMAAKRALADVTLRATSSSDLFTQDMEDAAPASESGPAKNGGTKVGGTPASEEAKHARWANEMRDKMYAQLSEFYGEKFWGNQDARGVLRRIFGTVVPGEIRALKFTELRDKLNDPTTGWQATIQGVKKFEDPSAPVADAADAGERQPGDEDSQDENTFPGERGPK